MIQSLDQLPFGEKSLIELLHLDSEPDPDFVGFGWAHCPLLYLQHGDGKTEPVHDSLVLGLHSADDAPAGQADILLAFDLGPESPIITTYLLPFLQRWLSRLPATRGGLVLAICNPQDIHPPLAALGRMARYALGDVVAWQDIYDDAESTERIRLQATSWHTAPQHGPRPDGNP